MFAPWWSQNPVRIVRVSENHLLVTERPIGSIIIWVIKQIGLLLRSHPILLITYMITDQIGLHSAIINHKTKSDWLSTVLISALIGQFMQIRLLLQSRPILLIAHMITDRTGLHSVLLPLWNWDICILGYTIIDLKINVCPYTGTKKAHYID